MAGENIGKRRSPMTDAQVVVALVWNPPKKRQSKRRELDGAVSNLQSEAKGHEGLLLWY